VVGKKVPDVPVEVFLKKQRLDESQTRALTPDLTIVAQITRTGKRAWVTHAEQRFFIYVQDDHKRGCLLYQSFSGTGGKQQGAWFPSGGVLVNKNNQGLWVIKGNPKTDPGAGREGLYALYHKANAVLPQTDPQTDVFVMEMTGIGGDDLTYIDDYETFPTMRILEPGYPQELQKKWSNWVYQFWALHGLTPTWGERTFTQRLNPHFSRRGSHG